MKILITILILFLKPAIVNVQATAQTKEMTIGIWYCFEPHLMPSTVSITKENGYYFKKFTWEIGIELRDEMIKKNDNLFIHKIESKRSYVMINTDDDLELWDESGNYATCKAVYKK